MVRTWNNTHQKLNNHAGIGWIGCELSPCTKWFCTIRSKWCCGTEKDWQLNQELIAMRSFMNCVGLPLFFVISGMSKGLQSQHNKRMIPRIVHLLSATLFSTLFFLIPAVFLGEHHSFCAETDSMSDARFLHFALSVFWKHCFARVGFGWLWFLPALCAIEIVSAPLIAAMRSPSLSPRQCAVFVVLALALFAHFAVLRSPTPQLSFALICLVSHCALFAAIRRKRLLLTFVCLPLHTLWMAAAARRKVSVDAQLNLKFVASADERADLDLTLVLFCIFHLFGAVFTKIVHPQLLRTRRPSRAMQCFQIAAYQLSFLLFFAAVSQSSPSASKRPKSFGNIWSEADRSQRVMFTASCWLFLFLSCVAARHTVDFELGGWLRRMSRASFVVYCAHGLCIEMVAHVLLASDEHTDTNRTEIVLVFVCVLAMSYALAFVVAVVGVMYRTQNA